jgi:hypothetical protein
VCAYMIICFVYIYIYIYISLRFYSSHYIEGGFENIYNSQDELE